MVKVFISQPMSGKTHEEIKAQRGEVFAKIADMYADNGEDCSEIPSYFGKSANVQMQPLELLGKSIELMAFADVAVFAPGWKDARGCRIEHECASAYGIEIIEL